MALESEFTPSSIEQRYYEICEERGYFEPDGNAAIQKSGKNFCIMLPPPNVTGSLHIGHALNHTISDIIVRFKRMDGYRVLWQPGTDHAGIATQNVVEKQLLAQGLHKEQLGREAFIDRVWEWKAQSGGMIVHQMRRIGASCAWKRERFTMDEGLKSSVKEAFLRLYAEGYIVRGNYMVNWCTHDGALSDIEVDYHETNGALYHIRYPLEEGGHLVVATTRPETYFGDTAVMVHPQDERYKHLLGQNVILPLINRKVPVIADEHVEMEFGTGVVKVTPAHDPNDYEVGKRHDLPFLTIFDEAGILNAHCGEFEGIERLEARKKVVERLEAEGFIEKIEAHVHQVGHCYRCSNVVEPYISKQWFVKKELAAKAIQKADAGETQFIPRQWKNNYDAWMRELRDWCISRQLWWGHRIPVMYCDDCGHEWGGEESEFLHCPNCSSAKIRQDQDVLDTWFSSALWPFSTLGWGNETNEKIRSDDLANFYPNSLLITGFDILFFWVARMMTMGEHFLGKLPFDDVFLHALVRDEHGQKMSKSKGNVIDPLDVVERYSADALRFALAMLCVPGRDIRLSEEKFMQARNFTNKLFNAAKYMLMNAQSFGELDAQNIKTPLGRFMLSKLSLATQELREHLDSYRFADAATSVYKFFWDDFCDWGLELSKADKSSVAELGCVYREALKLLHPFMPFLSEHLWQELGATSLESCDSMMVSRFPVDLPLDETVLAEFALIQEAIVSIRRAKTAADAANKKVPLAYLKSQKEFSNPQSALAFISLLSRCEKVEIVAEKPSGAVVDVSDSMESFVPVDEEARGAMKQRLEKQLEKSQKEYDKLNGMLTNEKFVQNAKPEVVEQNKIALSELAGKLQKIKEELSAL